MHVGTAVEYIDEMADGSEALRTVSETQQKLRNSFAEIESNFAALPQWDGTAKIRGKLLGLARAIAGFPESGDADGLAAEIETLLDAVRRLHAADPVTRLLQSVTTLRHSVETQRGHD
jgi:hypothetical protein